jgi:hypothetical protein
VHIPSVDVRQPFLDCSRELLALFIIEAVLHEHNILELMTRSFGIGRCGSSRFARAGPWPFARASDSRKPSSLLPMRYDLSSMEFTTSLALANILSITSTEIR